MIARASRSGSTARRCSSSDLGPLRWATRRAVRMSASLPAVRSPPVVLVEFHRRP